MGISLFFLLFIKVIHNSSAVQTQGLAQHFTTSKPLILINFSRLFTQNPRTYHYHQE